MPFSKLILAFRFVVVNFLACLASKSTIHDFPLISTLFCVYLFSSTRKSKTGTGDGFKSAFFKVIKVAVLFSCKSCYKLSSNKIAE